MEKAIDEGVYEQFFFSLHKSPALEPPKQDPN